MAVYTKLKEKDINNILSDYSIGKLKSLIIVKVYYILY